MSIPSISIGPIVLQSTYIIWGIGAILAYIWIIILNTIRNNEKSSIYANEWLQSLLLIAIVWKFSYVLIHPLEVAHSPERILFLNGGRLGMGIGIGLSFLIYVKSIHRIGLPVLYSVSLWMAGHFMWIGLTQSVFTLALTIYKAPLWLSGYFIALSLSYVWATHLHQFRSVIHYVQLALGGWVAYKVMFTTLMVDDVMVWISFVFIFGLFYLDYVISKGRGSK